MNNQRKRSDIFFRTPHSALRTFVIALRVTLVTLVLTGVLYPLLATGLAQTILPARANGSLVRDEDGKLIGSELIGQSFKSPAYFQSRLSAAGNGYDPTASGGSNLGPTSAKLKDRLMTDTLRLKTQNPDAPGAVPVELVTASGSGLDPHLPPEAVLWQAPRVARARGISEDRVRQVVMEYIEGRDLGFLGEPRINVLLLNLALDRQFGKTQ